MKIIQKLVKYFKANRPVGFLFLLVLMICFISMFTKISESFAMSNQDIQDAISKLEEKLDEHVHSMGTDGNGKSLTTGPMVTSVTGAMQKTETI